MIGVSEHLDSTREWRRFEPDAGFVMPSSVGTWTELELTNEEKRNKFKARVCRIEGDIAYPPVLFEENSISNILSSVVGNVFGFEAVSALH